MSRDDFEDRMIEFAKSRTLYPAPLLTHTKQGIFHSKVFMRACEWWGGRCEGAVISDYFLLFSKAGDRKVFERWWSRYSTWFTVVAPHQAFFPAVPTGRFSDRPSAFVPSYVDGIDSKHWLWTGQVVDTNGSLLRDAEDLYKPVFEEWAWMAAHCKRPAYRMLGGWLFSSASDAALFRLYEDERKGAVRKAA